MKKIKVDKNNGKREHTHSCCDSSCPKKKLRCAEYPWQKLRGKIKIFRKERIKNIHMHKHKTKNTHICVISKP